MTCPSPVPPNMCISTCSSRHMRKVLTWGRSPKRKMTGKERVNTVGGKWKQKEGLLSGTTWTRLTLRWHAPRWRPMGNVLATDLWGHLWRTAGTALRRRWPRKGRKAAVDQTDHPGQRQRSAYSTGRSTLVDCTQWSSYGPTHQEERHIYVRCFWSSCGPPYQGRHIIITGS